MTEHNNSNVCGGVLKLSSPLCSICATLNHDLCKCLHLYSLVHACFSCCLMMKHFPVQFILNPGHVEYELGVLMIRNFPHPNKVQMHDIWLTG